MAEQGRINYPLLIVLLCAGLLSGLVTTRLLYPALQSAIELLLLSTIFGFFLAACFGIFGVMRDIRGMAIFIGGSILAYSLAVATGSISGVLSQFGSAVFYSMLNRSRPLEPLVYSADLFVGGFVGAFVILMVLFHVVVSEVQRRRRAATAAYWSLAGGALAVIGWKLGPSLGMALWSGLHARGVTPSTETALNAAGQPSHELSLYLVWQTGMALILGLALQTFAASRQAKVTS